MPDDHYLLFALVGKKNWASGNFNEPYRPCRTSNISRKKAFSKILRLIKDLAGMFNLSHTHSKKAVATR